MKIKQTIFLYTFLCHVYQLETDVVLPATDNPLIICRSDSKSNQLQMLTVSGLQLIVTVIWNGVGLCKLTPLSREHKYTVFQSADIPFLGLVSAFCVKIYMFQHFLENNIWVCLCTQVSVMFKLIYLVFIMFISYEAMKIF